MGLDIYFYKANKKRYDDFSEKKNNYENFSDEEKENFTKEFSGICQDVAYFRKVNLLVSFFNYQNNCEDMIISKNLVDILLASCKEVLEKRNEDTSEKFLPTEGGFFFGSTDYDNYYYQKVQEVYDKFKTLNDNFNYDEDYLIMNCWW